MLLIRESSLACLILLFKTVVSSFRCEIILKNPFMGIFSPGHSIIKDTVVVSDSYYLIMQNFYIGLIPTEVESIC